MIFYNELFTSQRWWSVKTASLQIIFFSPDCTVWSQRASRVPLSCQVCRRRSLSALWLVLQNVGGRQTSVWRRGQAREPERRAVGASERAGGLGALLLTAAAETRPGAHSREGRSYAQTNHHLLLFFSQVQATFWKGESVSECQVIDEQQQTSIQRCCRDGTSSWVCWNELA